MPLTTEYLKVSSIIQNDSALTPTSGDTLFGKIDTSLQHHHPTIVDFEGIRYLTSAFLNASIGQLFAHYSAKELRNYLKIQNLSKEDLQLLAKVIERAKDYFNDKDDMDNAIRQVLND